MMKAHEKPIQGLHNVEDSCQSFWSLRAKIELSVFIKNDVESPKKAASRRG